LDITERKQVEEALEDSEAGMRIAIEAANMYSWNIDLVSQKITWSSNATQVLGIPDFELPDTFEDAFSPVHPDDRERVQRSMELLVETGKKSDIEFRYGESPVLWLRNIATVIKDAKQNPVRIVGITKNITKQKKVDEAIRRESEFNAAVLETARAAILIQDKDGRIIGFNRYCEEISGYSFAEVKNRKVWDFLLIPEEVDAVKKAWSELKAEMSLDYFENYWKTKDGRLIQLAWSSTVIPDSKGKPKYVIGIAMDITKRKQIEEELRRAHDNLEEKVEKRTAELQIERNKLSNILNTTHNRISIINKDYEIEYINPAMKKDFGPLKGHKCYEYFYNNPEVCSECKMQQSFQGGTFEWEQYLSKLDKTYDALSTPIINLDGSISVVLILNDVTKRKKAEDKLKKSLTDLEHSNEELKQFAYVVSHDLQEPLRTIASFTQLIEMRYKNKLDEDADEFINYIVEASIRMKEQIHGLLEYSRVANQEKNFKPVNTNEILNQTIKILNAAIKDSNAEITVEELPTVMGDSEQLHRVFQNLISNAIKFRKCEESLKIHISAYESKDKNEYVFSLQDNGIGIEEQYMERIFTIFQRLHTRDVYKGTGIGLSIVKRIIERHGGCVWVESDYNKGSTFYFTIPITKGT
jgi:PAS domain S-box-containing protein